MKHAANRKSIVEKERTQTIVKYDTKCMTWSFPPRGIKAKFRLYTDYLRSKRHHGRFFEKRIYKGRNSVKYYAFSDKLNLISTTPITINANLR